MRKNTTPVYGWEQEPKDERPSEFRSTTTGYSVLSGYHLPSELNNRAARRSRGTGLGFKMLVVVFLVLLALSGVAIHEAMKFLRA